MALRPELEELSAVSTSLASVVDEMTKTIAAIKTSTGDMSAVDDSAAILKDKILNPYYTYSSKSQILYLGDHLATVGAARAFARNIRWLRGMEHGGFSDDVWPFICYLYACCHNYTDVSKKFAKKLGKAKIIPILTQDLQEFKDTWTTDRRYEEIVNNSLGTLYNMSRYSSIRPLFDEENVIESLIPYLEAANEEFRTRVTLILAYVIDEENLGIMADPSVIRFIIQVFTKAVDDEMRRCYGFSATELAMGIERLAVNDTPDDNNKLKLVAEGVLPPLFKLMTEGDEEEQLHAIRAISQLAFHPDNREKIRPAIPQLLEFKSNGNPHIAAAASGALWQLQDAESRHRKDVTINGSGTDDHREGDNGRHVMLSYQWDNQQVVKKIKSALEAKGYKVWMDIDKMGGSTLEAMAGAVEGAAVVLVCMSRKYKESANCRRECVYAATRETDIIPLKMEDNYKPDGWLGITVGADLFFNFDDKERFEDVMLRLVKEIGDRGKDFAPVSAVVDAFTELGVDAGTHIPQRPSLHEDIRTWAEENQLEGNLHKLGPEDLHFLRWMRKEAPVEFCKSIEDELGLKSISSKRKFCDALEKLEKAQQLQTLRRDKSVVKGSSTCQII